MENISIISAFAAGLLSFLSPCVLPLLSSYLMFISGGRIGEGGSSRGGTTGGIVDLTTGGVGRADSGTEAGGVQKRILISTLFFVLGFSLVFVVLSIVLYGILEFAGGVSKIISIVSGSIIIIFGLNFIFNFIPFLKFETGEGTCENCAPRGPASKFFSAKNFSLASKGVILGPFLIGLAFGSGWTPCVGAFLGSVLLMAGQTETLAVSALYLCAYSAGLGLPFFIASIFWGRILGFLARIKRVLPVIRITSAVFLISIGLLMIFGRFILLNAFFQKAGASIASWVLTETPSVRFIPALLFLLIALSPLIARLVAGKKLFSPPSAFWAAAWMVLAALQASGLLNCAKALSSWLAFTGV